MKTEEELSLEVIEEALKEYNKTIFPSITHHVWEEDGQRYSAWKIMTENLSVTTGDGGMALIEEAFRKQAFAMPASFPKKKNHHRKQKNSKYIK